MNREIKFRAWDVLRKKMVNPVPFSEEIVVQLGGVVGLFNGKSYDTAIGEFELLQYTGLKDKNGKEIYEGDIVKCSSSFKCPHEVIWCEIPNNNLGGAPGFYLSGLGPDYSFTGDEEIIGNIYENPDLLQ